MWWNFIGYLGFNSEMICFLFRKKFAYKPVPDEKMMWVILFLQSFLYVSLSHFIFSKHNGRFSINFFAIDYDPCMKMDASFASFLYFVFLASIRLENPFTIILLSIIKYQRVRSHCLYVYCIAIKIIRGTFFYKIIGVLLITCNTEI